MATKKTPAKKMAPAGVKTTVRMYRHGLGDCFLLTLPGSDGTPFHIMIDCGVVLGTEDPAAKMQAVVQDIIATTGGHVDVLVGTHEHWDHLSGFLQVNDLFAPAGTNDPGKLHVGEVWFAWTEDPRSRLGKQLRAERQERLERLRAAMTGLTQTAQAMGVEPSPLVSGIDSLVSFFGANALGHTTGDALTAVRGLVSGAPRYLKPTDDPFELERVPGYRIYVLGPPQDEVLIRKTDSSKEVYKDPSFGAAEQWALGALAGSPTEGGDTPFDRNDCIPLAAASTPPQEDTRSGPVHQFFDRYYFGKDPGSTYSDQRWRRIDADWMGPAAELALALDSSTNNTSLVLALEHKKTKKVMLFAADAQVGNWLSWQDLKWKIGETEVTGPDLLRRTVLYKVGHHGSHNATLQAKGLELMTSEELIALLPVNHDMAVKKGWGRMPLPALITALNTHSKGRCLRADEDFDPARIDSLLRDQFRKQVTSTSLYHQIELDLT